METRGSLHVSEMALSLCLVGEVCIPEFRRACCYVNSNALAYLARIAPESWILHDGGHDQATHETSSHETFLESSGEPRKLILPPSLEPTVELADSGKRRKMAGGQHVTDVLTKLLYHTREQ